MEPGEVASHSLAQPDTRDVITRTQPQSCLAASERSQPIAAGNCDVIASLLYFDALVGRIII